ncbi:MAG: hypothetical protein ACR2KS_07780 [Candidatus Eremiobacter antarcticus]
MAAYAYKPQLEANAKREGDGHEAGRRLRWESRRRLKVFANAKALGFCLAPVIMVLLYVGLMAGLTAQTYRLSAQERLRSDLIQRDASLRSRVAQLESVDRLQAVARQLHMGPPKRVAVLPLPRAPVAEQRRTALLERVAGVAHWLVVR